MSFYSDFSALEKVSVEFVPAVGGAVVADRPGVDHRGVRRAEVHLEKHGERVHEICFQKRERFCVRELYQSYGEKQGESGDFFSLKATCFQKKYGFKNESFFSGKKTSIKVEETSFSSDNFALRKWRLPLS